MKQNTEIERLNRVHLKDVHTSQTLRSKFKQLKEKLEALHGVGRAVPIETETETETESETRAAVNRMPPLVILHVASGQTHMTTASSSSTCAPSSSVSGNRKRQKDELNGAETYEAHEVPNNSDLVPEKLKDKKPLKQKKAKFEEVVRKKAERANLTGRSCEECVKYFKSLEDAGFDTSEMINTCSRHRTKYTPPSTPEGYWDLSMKENCWDT
jgi:hypothetical protein